ncbi:MAG: zf-HC2 domain-containing protein [bacterium]
MQCPTREDLLLHLANDFQEQQEKSEMQQHLEACPNCHKQALTLERVLDVMRQESEHECDAVMANLLDYLDGKATTVAGIDMKEHLQECKACEGLQQRLAHEFSYEEVMALDYTVPESLQEKIEKILAANQNNSRVADFVEAITNKVDELVERIVLVLTPMPAPAFLGTSVGGTVPIETTATRDLKVDVGAAGRTVKIFSEDGVELGRQISGENGAVVFKDFVPATYKLRVEGFEIKDVTLWP